MFILKAVKSGLQATKAKFAQRPEKSVATISSNVSCHPIISEHAQADRCTPRAQKLAPGEAHRRQDAGRGAKESWRRCRPRERRGQLGRRIHLGCSERPERDREGGSQNQGLDRKPAVMTRTSVKSRSVASASPAKASLSCEGHDRLPSFIQDP